jgi:hypothetical protein
MPTISEEYRMKTTMGAEVLYCGHNGTFVADIIEIEGAVVVRPNGPVKLDRLKRDMASVRAATHHLTDSPTAGFWRPDLGVFVVPAAQVKKFTA